MNRTASALVKRAAREFPAVVLTGPRQAGKTTLLRQLFGATHKYVSLDAPDLRAAATADPRTFLELHSAPIILDEIQNAPVLLHYIKEAIDADRHKRGRYLLTGSQNLALTQNVAESLAGRAAMLRLMPLSARELAQDPTRKLIWEQSAHQRKATRSESDGRLLTGTALWKQAVRGWFPEIATQPKRDGALWMSSYAQTYLERDVRALRQVGDLAQFQAFVRVLAARSGQLLNMADVSRDLGIALNTVKIWLSVLEATYQVTIVRPYFANIGKRLTKTPKVYFNDTGMLCHLTGVSSYQSAVGGPLAGTIVETLVVTEIIKSLVHSGEQARIHFWRTATGDEVDFLVETERGIVPVEVKASATPNTNMAAGILKLKAQLGDVLLPGFVVHMGSQELPLAPGVVALPFSKL